MPKKPKTNVTLTILFILVSTGLIGYSAHYVWGRYTSGHQPLPNPRLVVGSANSEPSETAVNTKTTTYDVAADKPKLIGLPSLNSQGFIQQVAINSKTKAMATPSNVHYAGWYVNSVKPGEDGLSIINGHVSGRYQAGIFKNLSQLKPGGRFYVIFGDGSRRDFVVVTNQSYPVDQIANYLYDKDPAIVSQLNVITCGGQYDRIGHQYNQRVLVVAKRV